MSNINNINHMVVIGNNHIRYYNEVLKISNISRTWIFRFQNIEKKKFEESMRAYENNKSKYKASEIRKKKESIRNNLICLAVFIVLLVLCMSLKFSVGVFIFLCLIGLFAILAFRAALSDIAPYPYSSPREGLFPEKYGFGIEMNSGHIVTFTAIGDDGIKALRELQNDIENADVYKTTINFNLNENNITVENNDGLINTGDYANNVLSR